MADIKLKDWLRDVKKFKNDPMAVYRPYAIEMTFLILYKMTDLTIPDTGQARALVIKKFADKYGFDVSKFENETWDYWGNKARGLRNWNDVEDSQLSEVQLKHSLTFTNVIAYSPKSYPLIAQNKEGRPPSQEHPRPNADKYIPHHLDFVMDNVNAGNYSLVEGLEELMDDMDRFIAEKVMHGRYIG